MRRSIRVRKRLAVFVGCEGESERGYVRRLLAIAEEANLAVHLHPELLAPDGGDPLRRVEISISRLARSRTEYDHRFILMDQDQADADQVRADRARALARRHQIELVWQNPCHEALLLRHLEGCQTRRPQTSRDAEQALKREWDHYAKPMTAVKLASRVDLISLRRAAGVEPGLEKLLRTIGL